MPSIKDVAKEACVAPSTVSAVINGLDCVKPSTRERVENAIAKLGYTPNLSARALVTKKSLTIGILLLSYDTPEDTLFHGVPDNLSTCATQENMNTIIQAFSSDRYSLLFERFTFRAADESLPLMVLQKRVDAVFVIGSLYDNRFIARLRKHIKTIVTVGCSSPDAHSVCNNYIASTEAAVRYLIQNGHRRIAYVEGDIDSEPCAQKRQGYRNALEKAGIAYDPALVFRASFLVSSGYEAAERIANMQMRPSAVLFGSDALAIGAYLYFHEQGIRIPEDISIVGYENLIMSAFLSPPLTTVDMKKNEIAQTACKLMHRHLCDTSSALESISVQTHIIERCSVRNLTK